jgi:hypothetical protein
LDEGVQALAGLGGQAAAAQVLPVIVCLLEAVEDKADLEPGEAERAVLDRESMDDGSLIHPTLARFGLGGSLFDGPIQEHQLRLRFHRLAPGVGLLVVHLDQQPTLTPALADAGEGVAAGEPSALQPHRHVAVLHRLLDRDRLAVPLGEAAVGPGVPDDHRPGAILPSGITPW